MRHLPAQPPRATAAAATRECRIRARLGEDGYLVGKDAEAAACDAQSVPVVTGATDPGVIDKMIGLAGAAATERTRSRALSPEAWQVLRHAITRLAVDLISGPAGLAALLRQELLDKPFNTPSLPLDIG